jgi:hypothetical protein
MANALSCQIWHIKHRFHAPNNRCIRCRLSLYSDTQHNVGTQPDDKLHTCIIIFTMTGKLHKNLGNDLRVRSWLVQNLWIPPVDSVMWQTNGMFMWYLTCNRFLVNRCTCPNTFVCWQTIHELGFCLDDPKRLVRQQAVSTRSCWFLIGAPGESTQTWCRSLFVIFHIL